MLEVNKIMNGDCLEHLKELPDNSVDAIITDPPYGLAFMGKEWDTFNEYSQEKQTNPSTYKSVGRVRYYRPDGTPVYWNKPTYVPKEFKFIGKNQDKKNELMENFFFYWAKECLRVLKPGGYLLSFGGTRTYHRMTCGIEDAGFEIRDCIMWIYGSGFPKSLNIGKQLDKRKDWKSLIEIQKVIKEAREKSGKSLKQVGEECNEEWWHRGGYLFFETGLNLPTKEQWHKLKKCLNISDEYDDVFEKAEREVIGNKKSGIGQAFGAGEWKSGKAEDVDITLPATPEAKEWEGWGTALKPACEPIVVARKPLSEKNVALNVLKWGTGGINIDDSRIGTEPIRSSGDKKSLQVWKEQDGRTNKDLDLIENTPHWNQGRFPANIILDEESAKMLDEQSGERKVGWTNKDNQQGQSQFGIGNVDGKEFGNHFNDSGGASRFFYVAKASKGERNFGLDALPNKEIYPQNNSIERKEINSTANIKTKNNHPTVKPIKLMEYLIKLVSREGAIILDPFLGSGTTAIACVKTNRMFIGIEKESEYIKIAEARIKPFLEQTKLKGVGK